MMAMHTKVCRVATRPGCPGSPGIVLGFFSVLENVLEFTKRPCVLEIRFFKIANRSMRP